MTQIFSSSAHECISGVPKDSNDKVQTSHLTMQTYLRCWPGASKILMQALVFGSQAQYGSRARTQSWQDVYLLQEAVGACTTPESEPAYRDRVCGTDRKTASESQNILFFTWNPVGLDKLFVGISAFSVDILVPNPTFKTLAVPLCFFFLCSQNKVQLTSVESRRFLMGSSLLSSCISSTMWTSPSNNTDLWRIPLSENTKKGLNFTDLVKAKSKKSKHSFNEELYCCY